MPGRARAEARTKRWRPACAGPCRPVARSSRSRRRPGRRPRRPGSAPTPGCRNFQSVQPRPAFESRSLHLPPLAAGPGHRWSRECMGNRRAERDSLPRSPTKGVATCRSRWVENSSRRSAATCGRSSRRETQQRQRHRKRGTRNEIRTPACSPALCWRWLAAPPRAVSSADGGPDRKRPHLQRHGRPAVRALQRADRRQCDQGDLDGADRGSDGRRR